MRKALLILSLILLAAGVHVASAFQAGWSIREAVRTGDTATLERRVDWASVRATLKRSANETRQLVSEMAEASGVPTRIGLWQRIKSAALPFVADPLIDRYVTAEGAPQLWSWRQTWRQRVRPTIGLSEPTTPLAGTWLGGTDFDRALSVARRLDKATVVSPTRIEVELRDRYVEGRSWRAALELRDLTWMLTEVHLMRTPGAARPGSGTAGNGNLLTSPALRLTQR